MSRLAFYGGTFDPIHHGHLQAALDVRRKLSLDKVLMTPCFKPVHRDRPGATAAQRLSMLRLACEPVAGLEVDSREIDRGGPSFTVDSLRAVHAEHRPEQLFCLVGVDAFDGFRRWHRWEEILSLCHLVVMTRPEARLSPASLRLLAQRQASRCGANQLANGQLSHVSITPLGISATRIRGDVRHGHPIDYLLPARVANFIQTQGLYR